MTEIDNGFDHADALARCAQGDQTALRQLYQHEGARLLGVVLRIVKDRGMAEDIVHDACLNIWQKAASYDPAKGSARTWIFSIARHLALNALRHQQCAVSVDFDQPGELEGHAAFQTLSATVDTFDDQTGRRMDKCLSQLDAQRRSCLLHAYVDGLSHAEIAACTGMPLGTVKAWIKRSLVRLRECMA